MSAERTFSRFFALPKIMFFLSPTLSSAVSCPCATVGIPLATSPQNSTCPPPSLFFTAGPIPWRSPFSARFLIPPIGFKTLFSSVPHPEGFLFPGFQSYPARRPSHRTDLAVFPLSLMSDLLVSFVRSHFSSFPRRVTLFFPPLDAFLLPPP